MIWGKNASRIWILKHCLGRVLNLCIGAISSDALYLTGVVRRYEFIFIKNVYIKQR